MTVGAQMTSMVAVLFIGVSLHDTLKYGVPGPKKKKKRGLAIFLSGQAVEMEWAGGEESLLSFRVLSI